MFTLRMSYVSVLCVAVNRCRIPYASFIREIAPDGTALYGIELELPLLFHYDTPRRLFFWSSLQTDSVDPYENAALQALRCLQDLYGFTIVDYSYETLARERCLLRQLFTIANRGAHLARMVITHAHTESGTNLDVLHAAEVLLQCVDSMVNPAPFDEG